uniref:C2-C2_1 domain-containing protein n=1 Tax=Syphacia muris TaxID=451379 RepID=A0A0N5AW80_9BILA
MVLELQKVVVFTDCLKELGTLHPNLFFSIEFFDFELQTTPIFYGTE